MAVKYMLEVVVARKVKRAIMLPIVQSSTVECRPAKSREWTLGLKAIRENSGIREWSISLSGHSGYKFRLGTDKQGNDYYASGPDIFREFKRFIEAHEESAAVADRKLKKATKPRVDEALQTQEQAETEQELEAQAQDDAWTTKLEGLINADTWGINLREETSVEASPTPKAAAAELTESSEDDNIPELIFRAIDEDLALYVDIDSFTYDHNANDTNFVFEWSLALRSYADASDLEKKDASLLGGLGVDNLKKGTKLVDGLSKHVLVAKREVDRFSNEAGTALKEPMQAFQRLTQSVGGLVGSVKSIERLPAAFFDECYRVLEGVLQNTYDGLEVLTFGAARTSLRPAFNDAAGAVADFRTDSLEQMAFLGAKTAFKSVTDLAIDPPIYDNALVTSLVEIRSVEPVVEVQLGQGETLADLAEEYLGQRKRWPELVTLNGLDGPSTHGDGSPLLPGDKLLVPYQPASFRYPGLNVPVGEDPYGNDVLLELVDEDGQFDIALAGDDPTDFSLVKGPENYRQALTVRFLSVQGQSALFPSVGLPLLVGSVGPLELAGIIASRGRTQALRDARTLSVERSEVVDDGDTLVLQLEITGAAGGTVPIVAPLSQVGG